MRSRSRAWWPYCAVTLIMLASTIADAEDKKPKKKKKVASVAECTTFDQADRNDEDAVDLTVASTCEMKVACEVRWSLTCAPGTRKAKTSRHSSVFELEPSTSEMTTASAAECGFDGWEIAEIRWACDVAP